MLSSAQIIMLALSVRDRMQEPALSYQV